MQNKVSHLAIVWCDGELLPTQIACKKFYDNIYSIIYQAQKTLIFSPLLLDIDSKERMSLESETQALLTTTTNLAS